MILKADNGNVSKEGSKESFDEGLSNFDSWNKAKFSGKHSTENPMILNITTKEDEWQWLSHHLSIVYFQLGDN